MGEGKIWQGEGSGGGGGGKWEERGREGGKGGGKWGMGTPCSPPPRWRSGSKGCFCDISKAFDRVWHKGLIYKLKKAGINGLLLDWLSDYLTNKKQRVFIPGGGIWLTVYQSWRASRIYSRPTAIFIIHKWYCCWYAIMCSTFLWRYHLVHNRRQPY